MQFRATLEKTDKANGHVVNGELGTVRRIEGRLFHIEVGSGKVVTVDVAKFKHLDHGYAVTSYSSQGQTADRVIVNADTRESALLLNRRMAYVALSRAREGALVYTDSARRLGEAFGRRHDKSTALEAVESYRQDQSPLPHAGLEGATLGGERQSINSDGKTGHRREQGRVASYELGI